MARAMSSCNAWRKFFKIADDKGFAQDSGYVNDNGFYRKLPRSDLYLVARPPALPVEACPVART